MGFALLVFGFLVFPAWAADPIAGSVKTLQGTAVVRRGAESLPVREGMHLLANDTLQVAPDSRLGAILQDGTRIAMGPGAELTIDRFIYEPVKGKFDLLLRLTRGVLTYVSGRIAQFSPASVRVETPVGVVGLRGTHFAILLEGL
jgi:hypothetical protein